ncbi:MAG: PH domain-containing protein [Alphaproteobacteria bacterium]|nr:PH domain-containing protein [Alphaproteobacteria bacterium]
MYVYVKKMLLPDEHIVHMGTLHWIVLLPGLFTTIIATIFAFSSDALAVRVFGPTFGAPVGHILTGVALFFSVIGFFHMIIAMIRQSATELAITNKRLIAKYGLVSRNTFEIMANRVTGANFDQTIMGRLLGYGTIMVHGAGGDTSPFDLVSNPQAFHSALMSVVGKKNNAPLF